MGLASRGLPALVALARSSAAGAVLATGAGGRDEPAQPASHATMATNDGKTTLDRGLALPPPFGMAAM